MSQLKLIDIIKTYQAGTTKVKALNNVSLTFNKSGFVSILGPSGCGKTTLLNVIGGLDRYDSGDLVINEVSTKNFKDKEWDAYRNRSIGFVFQNYNLITHQSVLQNVEIAMTLSGVKAAERKKRAIEALEAVGIKEQQSKKPNQLSGGQMQRVAIARALVNNPEIILADEPTGSLDSHISIQIMEILKEISKTRLVIMVTHNPKMANQYSDRIINLLDGEIVQDQYVSKAKDNSSNKNTTRKSDYKNTAMSLLTATTLSFKNLLTKKGRTIITSLAGSIGIIGVALVLALSGGLSSYIDTMQAETLSGFPIAITTGEQQIDFNDRGPFGEEADNGYEKYISEDIIYRYDSSANTENHTNIITAEYIEYIEDLHNVLPETVNTISYARGVSINLLAKGEDTVVNYNTRKYWQEMPDNEAFVLSLYELIGDNARLPQNKNEVVLVVDEYNRIDEAFFQRLGIFSQSESYKSEDFIGKTILKVVLNNDYYSTIDGKIFKEPDTSEYEELYHDENGVLLTITGILRLKEGAASDYFSQGIVYTTALTNYIVEQAKNSEIATAQEIAEYDVLLNIPFANEQAKDIRMIQLGASTTPVAISIYPKDFDSKDQIKHYLDDFNVDKENENQIIYTDLAEMITDVIGTLLNTITYILIGFAAISLLVSTIMIGIITYVSVIERTKEIGILRSVGARKKDVSRVFNAETLIVGMTAGTIGVLISYLLIIPINLVIEKLVDIKSLALLSPLSALLLIVGSMTLTLIAGVIPSRMAAKKDPVEALRTE